MMLRLSGHFVRKSAAAIRQILAMGLAVLFVMLWSQAADAPTVARRAQASITRAVDCLAPPSSTTHAAASTSASTPARLTPELLHDMSPTPSVALIRSAATKPTTGPAIRGMYTGAAKSRIVWMEVTAYCPCTICCGPGARGITASGKGIEHNGGQFVAADLGMFAFGTHLSVPGYADGKRVEVIDRGRAIIGHRLDVFFPTHDQAAEWGRQWLAVRVEEKMTR